MLAHRLPSLLLFVVATFAAACTSSSGNPPAADGGGSQLDGGAHDAATRDSGQTADQDAALASDAGASAAPGAFTLDSPQLGDSDVAVKPTLSWTNAPAADSYTVEVSADSTFVAANFVKKTGVTDTSLTLTTALKPGVIYYWRVKAENSAGKTLASNGPFWMSSGVDVGSSPHGVAITPDGKTAVVANAGNPGGVTFVNLKTFATQALSFAGQVSSQPAIVTITPDGTTALVAQLNNVILVDVSAKSVSGAFNAPCVGTTLYGVAVTPDGASAVVPDLSSGCTKTVVDLVALPGATLTSAFQPAGNPNAFGVAVTPDGASALLTGGVTATSMLQLTLASGTFSTIANTSSTYGVAITPDGTLALATSGSSDPVKLIALSTGTVTGTIDYASNTDVGNLAITPNGKLAFVAGDFDVAILDIKTKKVLTKLPGAARSVAITPDGKRALFTGAGAQGTLHVIALP